MNAVRIIIAVRYFLFFSYFLLKKIASFLVNHLELLPGIYVSRKDTIWGEVITTFDIRMTRPNFEPVMNTAELHTIEHLAATRLRNHPIRWDKIIYFWPMGCRTWCYLLLNGDLSSKDIVPLIKDLFAFMKDYHEEVPGATARDCGCYLDHNLPMARFLSKKFYDEILMNLTDANLIYPNG